MRPLLSTTACSLVAGALSCGPQLQRPVPAAPPTLRFEASDGLRDSASARHRRGPVPQGQIFLRDTVTVPEAGMDVQGELIFHAPDTLNLTIHVGRARGGVLMMTWRVPYEASITGLPPGRYLLRRSTMLHLFTGDTRTVQTAPDSFVTIP